MTLILKVSEAESFYSAQNTSRFSKYHLYACCLIIIKGLFFFLNVLNYVKSYNK